MGALVGSVLLAIMIGLSVVVWRLWWGVSEAWWARREEQSEDLADGVTTDWLVLIDLLPRGARRAVKAALIWMFPLTFAAIHLIVLYRISSGASLQRLALDYLVSIVFCLVLLGLPAFVTARHRAAMRFAARTQAASGG